MILKFILIKSLPNKKKKLNRDINIEDKLYNAQICERFHEQIDSSRFSNSDFLGWLNKLRYLVSLRCVRAIVVFFLYQVRNRRCRHKVL